MSIIESSKTYDKEYQSYYKQLLADSIGENTPYSKTLEYIEKTVKARNLTPMQEAQMTVNLMSNIAIGTTNTAMTAAIELTSRARRSEVELKIMNINAGIAESTKQYKIDSAKADRDVKVNSVPHRVNLAVHQAENAKQNSLFTREKIIQLIAGAKSNNTIKAMDSLGELILGFAQGEIVPPQMMMMEHLKLIKVLSPTVSVPTAAQLALTKLV